MHMRMLKMDAPSPLLCTSESCLLKSFQSLQHSLSSDRSLRLTSPGKNTINPNYTLFSSRLKGTTTKNRQAYKLKGHTEEYLQRKTSKDIHVGVCERMYMCAHIHVYTYVCLALTANTNVMHKLSRKQDYFSSPASSPRRNKVSI